MSMAASILALSACSNNANDEVVVSSKAGDITKEQLYKDMKDSVGEQFIQMAVLDKVLSDKYKVTDKQIDAELDKMKEQLGDNLDAYLAQQGQTVESFKKIVRLQLLQDEALIDGIEVSEDEVNKQMEMMQTELNARHVLVDDEETALKVKELLEKGEDFAKVAKEYSTEPAAQETGGELDWFGYGKMVPEFWEGAYALELNKFSDPVKTNHGYHIIQVTDKRKTDTKVDKAEVEKELKLEKANQEELLNKISKLLKDADVKVKDSDLKSSLDLFLNQSGDEKNSDGADGDEDKDKKE